MFLGQGFDEKMSINSFEKARSRQSTATPCFDYKLQIPPLNLLLDQAKPSQSKFNIELLPSELFKQPQAYPPLLQSLIVDYLKRRHKASGVPHNFLTSNLQAQLLYEKFKHTARGVVPHLCCCSKLLSTLSKIECEAVLPCYWALDGDIFRNLDHHGECN